MNNGFLEIAVQRKFIATNSRSERFECSGTRHTRYIP